MWEREEIQSAGTPCSSSSRIFCSSDQLLEEKSIVIPCMGWKIPINLMYWFTIARSYRFCARMRVRVEVTNYAEYEQFFRPPSFRQPFRSRPGMHDGNAYAYQWNGCNYHLHVTLLATVCWTWLYDKQCKQVGETPCTTTQQTKCLWWIVSSRHLPPLNWSLCSNCWPHSSQQITHCVKQ